MGQYMNPASDVLKGRRIEAMNYRDAMRQVLPGEKLYAYCDRGIFKQSPHLFSEEEFMAFYSQYRQGMLLSFELYAVRE